MNGGKTLVKIRFKIVLSVILICVFYTSLSAIAKPLNKEKPLNTLDKDLLLEEGCMKSCLSDYSKIAKCDMNKMMSEYLTELTKEKN